VQLLLSLLYCYVLLLLSLLYCYVQLLLSLLYCYVTQAKRVGVTYQSVTFRGGHSDFHPRRNRRGRGRGGGAGGGRAGGREGDEQVVTKENWRALQDKADAARSARSARSLAQGQVS
jgi:hypothetical protein